MFIYLFICACAGTRTCSYVCRGSLVEVGEQLVGVSSLPPCGSQGANSGHQMWLQALLPVELKKSHGVDALS